MIFGAALLVFIGLVHSYLGERYILSRLLKRELPHLFGSDEFTKQTLRFAWHVTTVAWFGFAGLLFAKFESVPLSLQIISVTFLVTALIALLGSRGRHLSWIVFGAIAITTWFASLAAV